MGTTGNVVVKAAINGVDLYWTGTRLIANLADARRYTASSAKRLVRKLRAAGHVNAVAI